MKSRMWKGLVAVTGAALLAVTMGSAVVAMINDEPDPVVAVTRDDAQGGGALSAICAVGVTDCVDMIVDGEGGFEQCATDQPCGDFDACPPEGCSAYKCAADASDCFEPAPYMLESFSCEPGLTYEACFPDGAPADYDCATQESDPIVVVCKALNCGYYDGDGIDSPLPAEDLPGTIEILPAPEDPTLVDPVPVDPGIAIGEPLPVCVLPPVECEGGPAVDCGPIDPCVPGPAVDCGIIEPCIGGPAVDCGIIEPCIGGPAVGCGPIDPCAISSEPRCLPPDCTVSSDGAIACPGLPPVCKPVDDDAATEPDCIDVAPPSEGGWGSPGSRGAEATAVAGE